MSNDNNLPKKNLLSAQINLAKFAPATDEEKARAGSDERVYHLFLKTVCAD